MVPATIIKRTKQNLYEHICSKRKRVREKSKLMEAKGSGQQTWLRKKEEERCKRA